ncbi:MAG TPA: hypothetical protein VF860_07870 [Candidatus Acidoferrales bacterium]
MAAKTTVCFDGHGSLDWILLDAYGPLGKGENKAKNSVCFFFAFPVSSSPLARYLGLTLAVHQNEPGDTLHRL